MNKLTIIFFTAFLVATELYADAISVLEKVENREDRYTSVTVGREEEAMIVQAAYELASRSDWRDQPLLFELEVISIL